MEDRNVFLICSGSLKWSGGFSKSQGGKVKFSAAKYLPKPHVLWSDRFLLKDYDSVCLSLFTALLSNLFNILLTY